VPITVTLPGDNKVIGNSNHTVDHNTIVDAIEALAAAAVGTLLPSGDATTVTDSATVQALYNLGAQSIILGPGTFYLSGLQPASYTRLTGQGRQATTVSNGSSAAKIFDWGHAQTDTVEVDHLTLTATGADVFGGSTVNAIHWNVHDCDLIQNSAGFSIGNGTITSTGVMVSCIFERNREYVYGATRTVEAWILVGASGADAINQNVWQDSFCYNQNADASEYWYHITATTSTNATNVFRNIVFEHPYGGMIHLESHTQGFIEQCVAWDLVSTVGNHLIRINKTSGGGSCTGNTIINAPRQGSATFAASTYDISLDANCPQTTIIAPTPAGISIDTGGSAVNLQDMTGSFTLLNGPDTVARNIIQASEATNALLTIRNTASSPTNGPFQIESASAGDNAFGIRAHADTSSRIKVTSDGKFQWGPGNAGQDVGIFRRTAGILSVNSGAGGVTFGDVVPLSWVNAKSLGATGGGSADDSTAIAAALATGSSVYLPAGTYLLNSSTVLALATAGQRLFGDGPLATKIVIGASFSGAEAVELNAESTAVENLTIAGASSTTTSNPVADAIFHNGTRFGRVDAVEFEYVNGYCLKVIATSSNAPYGSMYTRLSSYKTCAGGIYVKSNTSVGWGAQVFLDNINMQSTGVGSGANANLDAFHFEDCFDVTASNINAAVSDASTGSTINIVGKCASLYFTNTDIGAFPNATSMTNAVIQIQDGANGSPTDVRFVQGEAQQGLNGLLVSGGANAIYFTSFKFFNNYGSGSKLTGTGSEIHFLNCGWSANGQGGAANSGTYYDLEVTSTATGDVSFSRYTSPVVAVGTNGVQNVVALPSAGYSMFHYFTEFSGSGTPGTPFTHVPGLYLRGDTNPPSWTGRMNVTSGQSSNSGFQARNTASTPSVPFSQFIANAAADQAVGVLVNGDTVPRLLVDSNGKHSWGAGGSSAADANLYRSAAGLLATDESLDVGAYALSQVQPRNHGLVAWTADPADAGSAQALTNGTLYLSALYVARSVSVSNIYWHVPTAAGAGTATENWVGLYSSAGTLLQSTGVDASVTSTGLKTTAITAQALTPGLYWVGFLFNCSGSPSQVSLKSQSDTNPTLLNVGLTAATARFALAGTALTALANITPSSNNIASGALPIWAAVS
jgi:hypothetical protein